jgi:hypothetical protein
MFFLSWNLIYFEQKNPYIFFHFSFCPKNPEKICKEKKKKKGETCHSYYTPLNLQLHLA